VFFSAKESKRRREKKSFGTKERGGQTERTSTAKT
jgi:hypothetical protein